MSARRAYVAITGCRTRDQIEICRPYVAALNELGYDLQVGLLVLREELRHEYYSLKHPGRMVTVCGILDCAIKIPGLLTFVHYCSKKPYLASETLHVDLEDILATSGRLVDGFQINLPWPQAVHPDYKLGRKELRMVLQIGPVAIERCQSNIDQIVDRVEHYVAHGTITDVLIDPSAGTGTPFNFDFAHILIARLRRRFPGLGIGVAGGLSPDNLRDRMLSLLLDFPWLSWDIETGVRNAEDDLDPARVEHYLELSTMLIRASCVKLVRRDTAMLEGGY